MAQLFRLLIHFRVAVQISSSGLEWPLCSPGAVAVFPGGWPQSLDWGLYWWAPDGRAEKAIFGQASTLYNPGNDTVIYFHGWMGESDGSTSYCYRPTPFCDPDLCKERVDMFEAWFQKGWNVGFFYWDQFADEPCIRDAEQKIWFDRHHDSLRWASYDVQNKEKTYQASANWISASASVGDMCAAKLAAVIEKFAGHSMQFVGHSIGVQLAAACGEKLHAADAVAKPTRLTMLDPIFTERHLQIFRCDSIVLQSGVGDFAAQATSKSVQYLRDRSVPIEIYKSSQYSENAYLSSPAAQLDKIGLVIKYEPDWCNEEYSKYLQYFYTNNWDCRHKASVLTYFLGQGFPPPPLVHAGIYAMPGACMTPSAACLDEELIRLTKTREDSVLLKHKDGTWKQVEGMATFDIQDDKFQLDTVALDKEAAAAAQAQHKQDVASALASLASPNAADNSSQRFSFATSREGLDDPPDYLSMKARWSAMPGTARLLVLGLGVAGTLMLGYGLQPLFERCCSSCCSAREQPLRTWSMDDSNAEDSDKDEDGRQ